MTFGQPVGETFGLVEVPEVGGVGLDGYSSVRTDGRGYAVLPYMQPYRYNWVNLDTNTLGSDTEISDSTQMAVPTRGAVVAKRFSAESGRRVQFVLSMESGGKIPSVHRHTTRKSGSWEWSTTCPVCWCSVSRTRGACPFAGAMAPVQSTISCRPGTRT